MTTRRVGLFVAGLLGFACAHAPPVARPEARSARPAAAQHSVGDAHHLLGRFAFGPRPGEAEKVAAAGVGAWLDAQLAQRPPQPELDAALAPYRRSLETPQALLERWLGDDWDEEGPAVQKQVRKKAKGHIEEIALAEVTRHILSERQVEEVMVDFWTNHFNVFAKKGVVRLFAGDFIERALRPHALGRFEDLLVATARHPAMLVYLDNAKSRVERQTPSGDKRGGLNENYARELLELHTLGVDGGYTQADVEGAARVLTGWSVRRPGEGGVGFLFRSAGHDRSEKTVLGQRFAAGGGEEEGRALLALLAKHPSTARHLAKKLCARFVSDDPPAACVDAAAKTFRDTEGDLARVVRSIAEHASFWAPDVRGKKLKSPLELVVSSARALGATPDGTHALARVLERMGEPILLESVPTGHPEAESEWVSTSGLLSRMSYASMLAAGKLPGLSLELARTFPDAGHGLVPRANALLLAGSARKATLAAVDGALAGLDDPDERRTVAVALLVGSPEYQRQ
ncbi:MAG: DUF1800 domain-containing protein [Polyangiaceae bacterium]|nr:DUF1800 domain-containing protein [Polyangiaceae bacterium]